MDIIILKQGGLLQTVQAYNPVQSGEPEKGYLEVQRGTMVRVYGDTEFTGYAANAYGEYIFAELYSPNEAQKSDRDDGTSGWRGWLPIDVLTVADA